MPNHVYARTTFTAAILLGLLAAPTRAEAQCNFNLIVTPSSLSAAACQEVSSTITAQASCATGNETEIDLSATAPAGLNVHFQGGTSLPTFSAINGVSFSGAVAGTYSVIITGTGTGTRLGQTSSVTVLVTITSTDPNNCNGGGGGGGVCTVGGGSPDPSVYSHGACNGTITSATISGDVEVKAGATCTLIDTVVNGHIHADQGSTLVIQGGSVSHEVEANGATSIRVGGDNCGKPAKLLGHLHADKTGTVNFDSVSVALETEVTNCGTAKVGNLEIGGHLHVEYTVGAAQVAGNSVGLEFQFINNGAGSCESGNTVGGQTQCQGHGCGVACM